MCSAIFRRMTDMGTTCPARPAPAAALVAGGFTAAGEGARPAAAAPEGARATATGGTAGAWSAATFAALPAGAPLSRNERMSCLRHAPGNPGAVNLADIHVVLLRDLANERRRALSDPLFQRFLLLRPRGLPIGLGAFTRRCGFARLGSDCGRLRRLSAAARIPVVVAARMARQRPAAIPPRQSPPPRC